MSQAKALIEHYRIIRERLRRPPNAVPDTGIDLKRAKVPKPTPELPPQPPSLLPIDFPTVDPFKRIDLTFSSTLEFAAREFNITPKDIRARSRIRAISFPRQVAIYIAAKHTIQSLAGMGRYLKMDHTTIIHARQKIRNLVETDATMRKRIEGMEQRLLANFNRITVPAIGQPHLGPEASQGTTAVGQISTVDSGG